MSYRCNERKRTREDNTYRVLDGAAEVEVEVTAVATSIVGSNPVACLVAVCQRHALQGRPGRAFRSLLKTTQLTDNPTLKVSTSLVRFRFYHSLCQHHYSSYRCSHPSLCLCLCHPHLRGLCRSKSCSSPAARTDGLRIECGEVTLGAHFYLATRRCRGGHREYFPLVRVDKDEWYSCQLPSGQVTGCGARVVNSQMPPTGRTGVVKQPRGAAFVRATPEQCRVRQAKWA